MVVSFSTAGNLRFVPHRNAAASSVRMSVRSPRMRSVTQKAFAPSATAWFEVNRVSSGDFIPLFFLSPFSRVFVTCI